MSKIHLILVFSSHLYFLHVDFFRRFEHNSSARGTIFVPLQPTPTTGIRRAVSLRTYILTNEDIFGRRRAVLHLPITGVSISKQVSQGIKCKPTAVAFSIGVHKYVYKYLSGSGEDHLQGLGLEL